MAREKLGRFCLYRIVLFMTSQTVIMQSLYRCHNYLRFSVYSCVCSAVFLQRNSLLLAVTGSVRLARDIYYAKISHNGTIGQAEEEPQTYHDKAPTIAGSEQYCRL